MACNKSEREVPEMSAAEASRYVRRMAEMETRGFGDGDNALARLEGMFGIPFWSLRYLKHGRAKSVDADLFARIRGAYLSYCERKVRSLQAELATESAIEADHDLELLEAEASKLAAKIAQAKARRQSSRAGKAPA